MIFIPPAFAYLIFALWVALASVVVYAALARTRGPQLWMSACGLIGGPSINPVYETDFWRPLSVFPSWLPLESMLFGAGFLGIVSAVTLFFSGRFLYVDQERSVRRSTKIATLVTGVLVFAAIYEALRFNSLLATAGGLLVIMLGIVCWRPDLRRAVWIGMLVAIGAYLVLVGGFVLMAENRAALAREFSMFYADRGAGPTTVLLTLWVTCFGGVFGAFYPWAKNMVQTT